MSGQKDHFKDNLRRNQKVDNYITHSITRVQIVTKGKKVPFLKSSIIIMIYSIQLSEVEGVIPRGWKSHTQRLNNSYPEVVIFCRIVNCNQIRHAEPICVAKSFQLMRSDESCPESLRTKSNECRLPYDRQQPHQKGKISSQTFTYWS